MKKYLLVLLVGLFGCAGNPTDKKANSQSTSLSKLFDAIDRFGSAPEDSLYRGFHPRGKWSSSSYESQQALADSLKKYKAALEAITDASLSKQEKISKEVMLLNLNDQIAAIQYNLILIPFNAEGGFYNRFAYSLNNLPFKTAKDYYDYVAWLPQYDRVLQDNIVLMKKGIADGVVAPKVIVNNALELLKPWAVQNYQQSSFYAPINKMPESIGEADRKAIQQESERAITHLLETYQTLTNFFAKEYMAAAKTEPGISFVPGGKEYYENRVRHYTTLPLTPDSVHNLGLQEVARIRAAMDKIIVETNFKGSFSDFLKFLRTDPQFYAKTPQELLNYAAWLSKKAEGQLPKFFNKLYTLPFTVEPVPAAIAPTYTGGRYVGGSWESRRAGIYWVNTYDLKSRTLYTIPSLTVHEAVPGHHLQGALAAEIKKDLPAFRNSYYISAFGEGWGLYSEYLGEEMGMYSTPYELFGRYTYEMWRACRLVVDTGIHYKGWTRDQALKYLAENTALSMHEVTTEIDRYIGWPGQALSYKIGELKIKSLRKKSEEALGKDFNIGDFHAAILQNGSVPLGVLERQVDDYIAEAQSKVAAGKK
ncbi:MAG TPA: DUF885 domain-containing protein [Cyclobacteriaceae bacterium]|nr:DUF885 domain-containing protein [Cyclobacteriaceae bacterium]